MVFIESGSSHLADYSVKEIRGLAKSFLALLLVGNLSSFIFPSFNRPSFHASAITNWSAECKF
jgi:hypothetical protein